MSKDIIEEEDKHKSNDKEKEEDIAKQILDDILNMNGLEKYVQAQNVFKVNGKKTLVRISNKGITVFFKRSISCFSLQNR